MAGAYRVAINAFSSDLLAPPPLNRVIEAKNESPCWSENGNQQAKQNASGFKSRPLGAIENAMVSLEVFVSTFARYAKASCNSPFACGKNRSGQQKLDVLEYWFGEQGSKGYNESHQFGRQSNHNEISLGRKTFSLLGLSFTFQRTNG